MLQPKQQTIKFKDLTKNQRFFDQAGNAYKKYTDLLCMDDWSFQEIAVNPNAEVYLTNPCLPAGKQNYKI